MDDIDLIDWLHRGIAAARAGDREQARRLLLCVIERDERNEQAWLWLSDVVDDPEERQICLENVLAIHPGHPAAQAGLRWLAEHGRPPSPSGKLTPSRGIEEVLASVPPASAIELDPYGCPVCGGPAGDEARCPQCGALQEVRERRRPGGEWLGWPIALFAVQGVVAWADAFYLLHLAEIRQLPPLLGPYTALLLAPAPAGGAPAGPLALVDLFLGAAAAVLAVGLAFRGRLAYFASLLLTGLFAVTAVAGFVARLTGLLPFVFRLALAAFCYKWLADTAPAFEWLTRRYNADLDLDLETALDYYGRGAHYWEMGLWAKAAAHWKVATRLEGSRPEFHAALARAYLKLGYPAAALAQAEKGVAGAPEDPELRALRDSLAGLNP